MAKKSLSEDKRRFVAERAGRCCEYCFAQEKFASHRFSVDHIIPPEQGGTDDAENLALSCQGCNNYKYTHTKGFDPETKTFAPLYHPRLDSWSDHFRWNENYTVIIGISSKGRATATQLRLNREMLINQRVLYRTFGIHPPSHFL